MAYLARYDRILKPDGDEFRSMPRGAPPAGQAAPASSSAPAAPSNPQASGASGFVSFDQRLSANQGAADKMAGKVATNTRKAADKTIGGIDTLQRGFNEKLQAGSLTGPETTPRADAATGTTLSQAQGQTAPPPGQAAPPAGQPVSGVPAGAPQAQPAPASVPGVRAMRSPYDRILTAGDTMTAAPSTQLNTRSGLTAVNGARTALANSPVNLQATGSDRDLSHFTYQGPDDLRSQEGFGELENQAMDADARLAATRDNAGLEQLVGDAYGGSRTSGGSALDAALTGAAGGERFADLRRRYSGLSKRVAEADAAAKAKADAARTSTADAAATYGKRADATDAERAAAEADAKAKADRAAELDAQAHWNDPVRTDDKRTSLDDHLNLPDAPRGEDVPQTTRLTERKLAMNDELLYEWEAAGSPPYDEWKASRGG